MKYNLTLAQEATFTKVTVNLHSVWVAVAALGCAFLVEATDVAYTYPLQLLLEGVVTDSNLITDISTK